MQENKMNWGTLVLGIVIGAVVVGVIWFTSKPAASEGQELRRWGISCTDSTEQGYCDCLVRNPQYPDGVGLKVVGNKCSIIGGNVAGE